jgi:hypothetical protein
MEYSSTVSEVRSCDEAEFKYLDVVIEQGILGIAAGNIFQNGTPLLYFAIC